MPVTPHAPSGTKDFFISYRGPRRDWALWINWVVRSAGYSTVLMDEFRVGTTWTDNMRQAAKDGCRLIPLYSADYWESGACTEEFDAYWRQHLQNRPARFLLPLGVEACDVPDMHAMLLYKNLFEMERDAARAAVLAILEGISPLDILAPYSETEPSFPGAAGTSSVPIEWPEVAPVNFRWPVADHTQARDAFARLVTRSSPHRLLTIKGDSGTGKSHLTKQIFNNAIRRLSDFPCGRFDFKGSSDLTSGFREFVQHLKVPEPPSGQTLQSGFSHILQALTRRAAPTLLIFDTYELAGEARRWITESLLNLLPRTPWLRVVIAGKETPPCHGQLWEEDTAPLDPLVPPGIADWFEYGKDHKPNLTKKEVETLYRYSNGKPTMLAALLGPAA